MMRVLIVAGVLAGGVVRPAAACARPGVASLRPAISPPPPTTLRLRQAEVSFGWMSSAPNMATRLRALHFEACCLVGADDQVMVGPSQVWAVAKTADEAARLRLRGWTLHRAEPRTFVKSASRRQSS